MPERATLRNGVTPNAGSDIGHPMSVSGRPVKSRTVHGSQGSEWNFRELPSWDSDPSLRSGRHRGAHLTPAPRSSATHFFVSMTLLRLAARGLYCEAGDFYIDPWESVERAVITHAHGAHA